MRKMTSRFSQENAGEEDVYRRSGTGFVVIRGARFDLFTPMTYWPRRNGAPRQFPLYTVQSKRIE